MSRDADFDVIVVGGRPAGAGLAARLGARGVRVLVLERATLPSLPAVPSCPVIYPSAMRLLDEIGFDESDYAASTTRMAGYDLDFDDRFSAVLRMPPVHGRAYFRGLDRAGFDHALWRHLARYRSVEARQAFSVTDLLRDASGRVAGVEGRPAGAPAGARPEAIRARCVVGADGRFSLVARKAGARIVEDCSEKVSTIHFADWEDVPPITSGGEPLGAIYTTGRGANVLFFAVGQGRVSVATHLRADRADIAGDAEAFYTGVLRRFPGVRRRMEGARRATPVLGVKRVANRYLEHGGPGWALVGDAFHHKDPVDGQGIYDALLEAKLLAEHLAAFIAGEIPWDAALERYRRDVFAATRPMFLATMKRLETELYEEPPPLVVRTLLRWMLTDPVYQRRFMLFLARAIPAEGWLPPWLIPAAAARGALRDLRDLLSSRRSA